MNIKDDKIIPVILDHFFSFSKYIPVIMKIAARTAAIIVAIKAFC